MNTKTQEIDILLVEDNEADIKLTQLAFERGKVRNRIHVARDGEEALAFIFRQNGFNNSEKYPKPDLILLDINMPKLDGFEVLQKIKANPAYAHIPVVMLTSSRSEQDIVRSYENGAASYMGKPTSFANYVEMVDGFNFYWHRLNELPPREHLYENPHR